MGRLAQNDASLSLTCEMQSVCVSQPIHILWPLCLGWMSVAHIFAKIENILDFMRARETWLNFCVYFNICDWKKRNTNKIAFYVLRAKSRNIFCFFEQRLTNQMPQREKHTNWKKYNAVLEMCKYRHFFKSLLIKKRKKKLFIAVGRTFHRDVINTRNIEIKSE